MNYIGSKRKLSDFITGNIASVTGGFAGKHFAELFGGTYVISRAVKPLVAELTVNDIEPYSYILAQNYIGNSAPLAYEASLAQLNALSLVEGFIYQHYCMGSGSGRQYFSNANGQRIDAVRQQIEQWRQTAFIDEAMYYFLLASLLESADKVANTASVYGAFLKHLKRSAQQELVVKPAHFESSAAAVHIFNEDANSLIRRIEGDILYLDPPYNARQYGANYHLLNTITLYDRFEPKGKTGLRHYPKSAYCRKPLVAEAFEELIAAAQFRYIFVSYNNEGLLPAAQLRSLMSRYGRYDLFTQTYERFKADRDSNRQHKASQTLEYLHILEKTG
ncbi:DNA adenine methylase [Eisenibacter elegans]|jgi:adenine-specific DNA-methyltransferase|uniref:DNA adenine methylase n=1 Tax=Eisenibacter elegans TaxID=997 RepID=UPI00047BD529|nr:DNA adenine methylase [Eisenibacter elegans]